MAIMMSIGLSLGIEEQHLVSVEEGVFARFIGEVGVISQYDRVNIVLEIPEFILANKIHNNTAKCLEYPTKLREAYKDLYIQRENFVQERLAVLKEYSVAKEAPGSKEKRSILAWLGTMVGSLAYTTFLGGLSQVQIRKLNSHLKDTQKEVQEMAIKLKNLQENEVIFQEKTVGIIQSITKKWLDSYTYLECRTDLAISILDAKMNLFRYRDLIDSILFPALSGRNHVLLTSKILDINILNQVVKSHPVFANSEFASNPALLYSTSFLSLVGVNQDLTTAQMVLEFPIIKRGHDKLFEVKQVGLHTKGSNCLYFNIPGNVAAIGEELREVVLDPCTRHHDLFLCPQHSFSHVPSCYQASNLSCSRNQRACSGSFQYIRADSGLLFRSNANGETFIRDKEDKIRSVKMSQFDTAYVSWANANLVQFESITLLSPGVEVDRVVLTDFSTNISWADTDETAEELAKSWNKIVGKYGSDIESLMSSTLKDVSENKSKHESSKTMIIVALSLIGIIYGLYAAVLAVGAWHKARGWWKRYRLNQVMEMVEPSGRAGGEGEVSYEKIEDGSPRVYTRLAKTPRESFRRRTSA